MTFGAALSRAHAEDAKGMQALLKELGKVKVSLRRAASG